MVSQKYCLHLRVAGSCCVPAVFKYNGQKSPFDRKVVETYFFYQNGIIKFLKDVPNPESFCSKMLL